MTTKIALIGNPNSGKTTLFNALTGSRQKVGNWPGVTVERKEGSFSYLDKNFQLTDLPGVYSLSGPLDTHSADEQITLSYLMENVGDIYISLIDVTQLERQLYLTTQLLEMGLKVIIALNHCDMLEQGYSFTLAAKLSQQLCCPVVPISALNKTGLQQLLKFMALDVPHSPFRIIYTACIEKSLATLKQELNAHTRKYNTQAHFVILQLLVGNNFFLSQIPNELHPSIENAKQCLIQESDEELTISFAKQRYQYIASLAEKIGPIAFITTNRVTAVLDHLLLHRLWGLPCFFAIIYFLFFFAMTVGGAFQDFFDLSSQIIFVHASGQLLHTLHAPEWLIAVIAGGIGNGINTVLTFVPVLTCLYFGLSLLEASGYMVRAAFVMDRVMHLIGLPGKSFVPLLIGFGCNVPAILATRTLENPRDRILTILMTPFMSCSARLAIYAVFTATFFSKGGQDIVFLLYIIGVVVAILSGLVLRKTWIKGETSPLVMELPAYQLPSFKDLCLQAYIRVRSFVQRAGKVILPLCVCITLLAAFKEDGHFEMNNVIHDSLLAAAGQWLTPLFTPMGIASYNWPATVGLITGSVAKEVVIATLNTLYTTPLEVFNSNSTPLLTQLYAAVMTIPAHLNEIKDLIFSPLTMQVGTPTHNEDLHQSLAHYFGSQSAAFAYLLFILLYYPCISTIAVIARELNNRWAVFATLWTTFIAYSLAVIYYQLANLSVHPLYSLSWVGILLSLGGGLIMVMKNFPPPSRVESFIIADNHCAKPACRSCEHSPGKFVWGRKKASLDTSLS